MNTLREIFANVNKVERIPGFGACWEWRGTTSAGYGQVRFKGVKSKVHRLVFGLVVMSVDGVVVRHMCDNRRCCNPMHMQEGSQRDNVCDAFERGRCQHWHSMSPDSVVRLRLLAADGMTDDELSILFSINRTSVAEIRNGKSAARCAGPITKRNSRISPEVKATIESMNAAGSRVADIARELNIQYNNVWNVVKSRRTKLRTSCDGTAGLN